MNQTLTPAIVQVMPTAYKTGMFVSLASFTQPPLAVGPTGNPTGAWTPVSGLQNIPCMDAPESTGNLQATEVKDLAEILSKGIRHVLLNGFFAQLFTASESGWRCTVDGVLYDLLGAEADSQNTQTRLRLQRVEL